MFINVYLPPTFHLRVRVPQQINISRYTTEDSRKVDFSLRERTEDVLSDAKGEIAFRWFAEREGGRRCAEDDLRNGRRYTFEPIYR